MRGEQVLGFRSCPGTFFCHNDFFFSAICRPRVLYISPGQLLGISSTQEPLYGLCTVLQ